MFAYIYFYIPHYAAQTEAPNDIYCKANTIKML